MVDSVRPTTISTSDLKVASVTRVPVARPVISTKVPEAPAPAPTLAQQLAKSAPIDSDRVKAIKTAIANGTFPLSPATIADQLIALKYEWMSNEPA